MRLNSCEVSLLNKTKRLAKIPRKRDPQVRKLERQGAKGWDVGEQKEGGGSLCRGRAERLKISAAEVRSVVEGR